MSGARRPRAQFRYCMAAIGACLILVFQSAVPMPVQGSADEYDVLVAQLNGLITQRTMMMNALVSADGTVGSLLGRDLLSALQPALRAQSQLVDETMARVKAVTQPARVVRRMADRSDGPGVLLGAHLVPSPEQAVPAPTYSPKQAWQHAVLDAPGLTLQTGLSAAGSVLAPIHDAPAPVPATQFAALGDAQDLAPLHGVESSGGEVLLTSLAPQAAGTSPPAAVSTPIQAPTSSSAHGSRALAAMQAAASAAQSAVAAVVLPADVPSSGLNAAQRVTSTADLQAKLGLYVLKASLGGPPAVPVIASYVAPEVTWTITSTTALTAGTTLLTQASGHADGGSLHDLTMHTLQSSDAPAQVAQPGTTLSLMLTPDGAGTLTAVTAITGTSTITTTARIDNLLADSGLQDAVSHERLILTEVGSVVQAGNAVYARLHPLYAVREQAYLQNLSAVMQRNAALEQTWWNQTLAWRSYQLALTRWRHQQEAWNAYVAYRTRRQPVATPGSSPPSTVSPLGAGVTSLVTATATLTPIPGEPPIATTPGSQPADQTRIFTGQGGGFDMGASDAVLVAAALGTPVPIFGAPVPSEDTATAAPSSPTPTEGASTPTEPVATLTPEATSTVGAASPTIPADTAVPSASPTQQSPTDTDVPLTTPSSTPSSTPAEPSPTATSIPQATPKPVLPPGPAPAPVQPPGQEPISEPLPPPLPALPPWTDAPPPVLPHIPASTMSASLGAYGHAELTLAQLLADGALDNVGSFIPPLQGVITTLWGGSTPWQSFHTGIDIATTEDTPVHAAAGGIVIYAGLAVPGEPTVSYGNCVMIQHNAHVSTLYGHMDMGLHGLAVGVGQVVRQGQVIGYEGATGWATGPHVHFEMRLDNTQFDPLLLVNLRQITG